MRLPTAMNVWIVDDDPLLLELLASSLTQRNISCLPFDSAPLFRDRLAHDSPACVLADLRLGHENGLTLIDEVFRLAWPAPAILLSGYLSTATTVRAMQSGLVTVLEKPLSMSDVLREVTGALAKAKDSIEFHQHRLALQQQLRSLTPSQRSVLQELVNCTPHKLIAKRLSIGLRTVEKRKKEVYEHLGVDSLAQLIDLLHLADVRRPHMQVAVPCPNYLLRQNAAS